MPLDPQRLTLLNSLADLSINDGTVTATAPARTNAFISPEGNREEFTAPVLWLEAEGDFAFSARVAVDLRQTYDAAGLFVVADERRWIKGVVELTDLGHPAIVSVVTDGVSDDANGERWSEPAVWLQVVRKGRLWCLHFSDDGEAWRMTRYAGLDWPERVRVGLTVQSPLGEGCRARFDALRFGPNPYRDVRAAKP